jgi:4-azaleucine resistance transporter AzlC
MSAEASDPEPSSLPRFTARGVWRGCVEIAPLSAFSVPFGIAFGVAATAKGVSADIGVLMSLMICAGASQFAALELWYAPLPLTMLALTALAVNGRYILAGAVLAPWLLKLPLLRRTASLVFLSDANFAQAVAARERGELDAGTLLGSGLMLWATWVAGTAIGVLGGSLLGDLSRFGFDAVMAVYFAAVVTGQWKGPRDLYPWLAAATVALLGAHVLPTGWHIIAGGLAGGVVGAWRHG